MVNPLVLVFWVCTLSPTFIWLNMLNGSLADNKHIFKSTVSATKAK